jgi:hypothetical protein
MPLPDSSDGKLLGAMRLTISTKVELHEAQCGSGI